MTAIKFVISRQIANKLKAKHGVTEREILECFYNREHPSVIDDREEHKSDPPTEWFISCTDKGRKLKVIYVLRDLKIYVKSAFEVNEDIVKLYNKLWRTQNE